MKKRRRSLKSRLYMLMLVCLVPLLVVIFYLITVLLQFSARYDAIVQNITIANEYNIDFKEELDYIMYTIVVNGERAAELVDIEQPFDMIEEAQASFELLYSKADADYTRNRLSSIIGSLGSLRDRVEEIEKDALVSGAYEINMERLDLNIRGLTELIQEQIQKYIYYETVNLKALTDTLRVDMKNTITMVTLLLLIMLSGALFVSRHIMKNITEPIRSLCEVAKKAGRGDFEVRIKENTTYEIKDLYATFNQMIERIGNLVEDIRIDQINLRAAELKLLQSQINPHFLYNTLDAIIWLAEAGKKEQVVQMVTSLSEFFRTTLSKGQDYITVQEEELHIRSYLEIQQFRYRDILEYEIDIPKKLHEYQVLKLTLQPLVENALYHGIKNKRGMGRIRVTGEQTDTELILKVYDNGIGMTPERLQEVRDLISGKKQKETNEKSGFGLFNVEQRIRLNYGASYGLSVESQYGVGSSVTVTLPIVKK